MQYCHKEITKKNVFHFNYKLIWDIYGLLNINYKIYNKKNFNNSDPCSNNSHNYLPILLSLKFLGKKII
jgi:hypothetical protein